MMKLFFSLYCLLAFIVTSAQVKLPRLISDSMILQRDADVKIWGWAAVDEKITVKFHNKTYSTKTGKDSKWLITLSPMHAGGPHDMQIDGSNQVTIKNILIGDVWVCSGQSNMELPMERLKDKYPAIISSANNSNIRQFDVSTNYNFHAAQQDLPSGNWETATAESVLHFTAVGYFFAKALYEKYHIPIGLIKSAVGGSPAEAWLSAEALKQFPTYQLKAVTLKNDAYVDSIKKSDKADSDAWYNNIWQNDAGLHGEKKWFDTSYNAAAWGKVEEPSDWKDAGIETNGVVWFRKTFHVPSNMLNKPVRLFLGTIVDRDSVYINGIFTGATQYRYPPRKYVLPAGLLKEGENVLVVRVINYAGMGGFTKDKPYKLFTGNDTIHLEGTWQYKLGATSAPIPIATTFNYMPGGLFNAMMAPLTNYSIKGVIWYQGESNTSRAEEYHQLFSALIKDWRQQWKQGNFPFLYVQLANFMKINEQPSQSDWAALREAQFKTLAVPNTGMAVTTDLGEWNDIHPLNKEDVGKRLALAAGKIAYYEKHTVYSGPLYKSMKIEGNKIIIRFVNVGSGLMAKDGDLKYFSIAGDDKNFVWAKAVIKNNTVVVWNDAIKNPVAVRYAWADNPEGANLYNKEGLPASAFTTDK